MLAHIIELSDVFKCYLSVFVHIELVVGLLNVASSECIQVTSQRNQELIEADSAAAISVEVFDEDANLLIAQMNIKVLESPLQLVLV